MEKQTVKIRVVVDLTVNIGQTTIQEVIDEMEYQFTDTTMLADIVDTEIVSSEVVYSV